MKCSIIDGSTICFDHLATPLQHILLIKVCMRSWSRLAQALCKMRWSSSKEVPSFTFLLAFCLMLSQRFSILQDPPTATPSRTSGITSSRKPTRRWRTIPLWMNSSAFCREGLGQPGSTVHTNFDQQYAEEVSRGDQSRWWTHQLLNTSFIVMLIKSKT